MIHSEENCTEYALGHEGIFITKKQQHEINQCQLVVCNSHSEHDRRNKYI
jgi:hypothetical protein